MKNMKKVKFKLQVLCTVGCDDNEDIATIEVDSFSEVLEISSVLKKFNNVSSQQNKELKEEYVNIVDSLVSNSGEEIMIVGEVIGIQCIYEDEKGIKAEMTLNNDFGVDGWVKVNSTEYENEYKKLLEKSKKLATEILKL